MVEILGSEVRLRVEKVLAPPQRPLKTVSINHMFFLLKKIDENDLDLVIKKTIQILNIKIFILKNVHL